MKEHVYFLTVTTILVKKPWRRVEEENYLLQFLLMVKSDVSSPHSSVDRALPSGGKNPRSSRGGGTKYRFQRKSGGGHRRSRHLT